MDVIVKKFNSIENSIARYIFKKYIIYIKLKIFLILLE